MASLLPINKVKKKSNIRFTFGFVFFYMLLFNFESWGQASQLFTDEILNLTLSGDLRTVFKDRGDDSQYHSVELSYFSDQREVSIPLKIKTRGNFRKSASNCKYPPLMLNFPKSEITANTLFTGQNKMKLVTPCQGDQYVVNEYLVYKLYNLFSPQSFKAQLLKISFEDMKKQNKESTYYGLLLENEDQMAQRNQASLFKKIGFRPSQLDKDKYLEMTVFEYLIGNTDWSVQYQQNIKLIKNDSDELPIAVPYDFDHAGIVRSPYAKPAPALKLNSVLTRRYRGYCITEMSVYQSVFDKFNKLKPAIYALYNGNKAITSSYKSRTVKFLDDFYDTINDPKKALRAFGYPCDPSGTGNVVIKGLRKTN
ncbi:MAG: hypothetical protein CMB82_11910 [Flammeovirgaceae bacterium]|nr:hypothetical protein [Flammeovirgaceae bacterium]